MNHSHEFLGFQHVHVPFILSLGQSACHSKLGALGKTKADRVVINRITDLSKFEKTFKII